ncbi:MAG: sigma-70 family RNA polymerase sigma factor [Planctomycetes bacterium]|nr:sigma-70 family RNA polymerase sigma factor [Planctomycetota bacterium]MCC7169281.1 sigma-70 family RNA polymerase sigma factor [Planctomycetota bacterium]
MDELPEQITFLLRGARGGDKEAGARLLPVIYAELHRLARRSMNGQSKSHLLQATALVNEAFLRLIGGTSVEIADRTHFFNMAALAMRQILIDHARAARAGRATGRAIDFAFDELVDEFHQRGGDVLELEDALRKLAAFDADLERIVNLKFFGGLSSEEIAIALDRPLRSVERDWSVARRWLARELGA